MLSLSVTPLDSNDPGGPADIDGSVVDNLESLRQRVDQRLRFPLGTWALDLSLGTPSILGHQATDALAARVIVDTVREEAEDEILDVTDVVVNLNHDTRVMRYSLRVVSIHGDFRVDGISL